MRTWAIAALGRTAPDEAKRDLLSGLEDESPTVVREAASALLNGNVDCSRELGSRYRDLLKAHVDIVRNDWEAVAKLGPAAFPVLFRASASGSYVLGRQAKELLRQMLAPYVPELPDEIGLHPSRDGRPVRAALGGRVARGIDGPDRASTQRVSSTSGRALRVEPDDPQLCELAFAALAALLYSRPELVVAAMVERIADLLANPSLPDGTERSVVKLFECLAAGGHAPRAWPRLSEILQDQRLDAARRERLLPLVSEFVQWRADLVGLDGILALAQCPALAAHRTFLFDHGLECFVFRTPEAFTVERLQRIADVFGDTPRYHYVLYSLAARTTLAPGVSAFLARELAGRFPHQEAAAAILTGRPVCALRGDEHRDGTGRRRGPAGALTSGTARCEPGASITLVTWRTYLYDNPRVTTIPIADDAAIAAALAGPLDGVIEFFQPETRGFTFRIEAHAAVESYLADAQAGVAHQGGIGRAHQGQAGNRFPSCTKPWSGGQDIARSRGLDQSPVRNVYEPAMRLLAELGLPQRAAEDVPITPSVLTGTRSADAERVWADMLAQESGAEKRPVALVNPLAAVVSQKVSSNRMRSSPPRSRDSLPKATWSSSCRTARSGHAGATFSVYSPTSNPRYEPTCASAPDPAETDAAAQLVLPERSTLCVSRSGHAGIQVLRRVRRPDRHGRGLARASRIQPRPAVPSLIGRRLVFAGVSSS